MRAGESRGRKVISLRAGVDLHPMLFASETRTVEYQQDIIGVDATIEVWCREDEVEDIALGDEGPVEDLEAEAGEE